MKPISIREAMSGGNERLRNPGWANKSDHVKFNFINGGLGPWMRIFSPLNVAVNGRDPVEMLSFGINVEENEWIIYDGPLPDSEEYKKESESATEFFRKAMTEYGPTIGDAFTELRCELENERRKNSALKLWMESVYPGGVLTDSFSAAVLALLDGFDGNRRGEVTIEELHILADKVREAMR